MKPAFFTDMTDKQQKSGKLLLGFFALMLAFTLISRSLDAAAVPKVTAQGPGRGDLLRDISFTGTVESIGSLPVTSPSGYRIQHLLVEEGSEVEQGDVLAILDADDLSRRLSEAERSYEKSRLTAELGTLEDDENPSASLRDAELRAARAEEDLQYQKDESDRAVDRASSALSRAYRERRDLRNDGFVDEDDEMKALNDQIRQLQDALEEAEASAEQQSHVAQRTLDDARQKLEEEQALEDKRISGLSAGQQRRAIQSRLSALELEELGRDIADIRTLVENGGQITAPIAGVVQNLSVAAGDPTSGGSMMLISDRSMGSRVRTTLEEDQGKHLKRGDMATIYTGDYGKSISGIVSSIKAPEKKGGSYEVTVMIPEDAPAEGTPVQIKVQKQAKTYGTLVPLAALHSNNNSSTSGYVLVIREQPGIMGTQLVAERVDVQIVEQGANAAAVEGPIMPDDKIITAGSRPISDGDRVRLGDGG